MLIKYRYWILRQFLCQKCNISFSLDKIILNDISDNTKHVIMWLITVLLTKFHNYVNRCKIVPCQIYVKCFTWSNFWIKLNAIVECAPNESRRCVRFVEFWKFCRCRRARINTVQRRGPTRFHSSRMHTARLVDRKRAMALTTCSPTSLRHVVFCPWYSKVVSSRRWHKI